MIKPGNRTWTFHCQASTLQLRHSAVGLTDLDCNIYQQPRSSKYLGNCGADVQYPVQSISFCPPLGAAYQHGPDCPVTKGNMEGNITHSKVLSLSLMIGIALRVFGMTYTHILLIKTGCLILSLQIWLIANLSWPFQKESGSSKLQA